MGPLLDAALPSTFIGLLLLLFCPSRTGVAGDLVRLDATAVAANDTRLPRGHLSMTTESTLHYFVELVKAWPA